MQEVWVRIPITPQIKRTIRKYERRIQAEYSSGRTVLLFESSLRAGEASPA